ncbi:MAG: ATP-binding protein [Chlorobiaceae bacterium]
MTEKKIDIKNTSLSAFEEALRKREWIFTKAMAESLPGSFSVNDENGLLVWWNAYYRDVIVGKTDIEMASTNAVEAFHPDDRSMVIEKMTNVLTLGTEEVGEGRIMVQGGPKFQWRMITGKRIVIDGHPFVVAVGIDITARKRREAITALRLRLLDLVETHSVEELLKAALDEALRLTQSATGFFNMISDDQKTFSMRVLSTGTQAPDEKRPELLLNEAGILADATSERRLVFNNFYGASTNPAGKLSSPDTRQRILFNPLIQGETLTQLLCVGGKSYDYDEDDAVMVEALANLASDIVARKHADLSEQKLLKILFQAQKMEMVGQLAGGIAHDFNNMFGVILGNVEMAMNWNILEEPILGNMKAILKATEHSADLTRQLIAFSRKQTVMPIVLDLNIIVEKMLSVLRRLIGENITVVWIPEPQRTSVKTDPSQIDLMLANLCVNSRDAIKDVGKITIETRRVNVSKTECTAGHACKNPGEYVLFAVTDNGCGIDQHDLPHIFEPFFTTKENRNGTGMGLATIYGIVKQNNAFIECLSELGRGTTFNIYMPLHLDYGAEDRIAKQAPSISHRNELILLVEDEPDILNIYKLMLESKGYGVLDAVTPSDALRIAHEYGSKIHLLITDVVLPEMNGCELSKQLKLLAPDLKVLFISGYTPDDINIQGELDLGVNFIQKPFSLKALIFAIQKLFSSPE